jgi:hypothetical protein
MLQAVTPAIKAADPEAQVLLGGLLLDKEPAKDSLANPPGRFLEGILQGGGGDYFDIVSFHSYALYAGQPYGWEMQNPAWADRGGGVAGKVAFIRDVLSAYGYQKPLMLTEAGLLCYKCESPPPSEFLSAQAAYVPQLYTKSIALGLLGTVWYTLDGPGWRHGGLLDKDQNPRPSYQAFMAMTALLREARYDGPVKDLHGLDGHAFTLPKRQVWVVWSPDGSAVETQLPEGTQAIYNLFGDQLEPEDGSIEVDHSPVYLELLSP